MIGNKIWIILWWMVGWGLILPTTTLMSITLLSEPLSTRVMINMIPLLIGLLIGLIGKEIGDHLNAELFYYFW